MKALLVGNYGVGNLGDEALKTYFLERFPEVEWIVVSAHPGTGEYARLPAGVRSLFAAWPKTVRALRSAEALVFGGGSLFTDTESWRACIIWFVHALWARMLGKKIYLAFQGIGPFHGGLAERLTRWVVCRAAFVSVRDEASRRRLETWGLNLKIVQSFDPVLSLINEEKSSKNTKNVFVVIPRFNSAYSFSKRALELHDEHPELTPEVWLFEPGNHEEELAGRALGEHLKARVFPCTSFSEVCHKLVSAKLLLTQRYHAGLFGFAAGAEVEIVPQKIGDKLSELSAFITRPGAHAEAVSLVQKGEKALRSALGLL